MNAVQELARLYGVADAYVDYRAQPREVSLQSQAAILAAIGVDAADEQAAAERACRLLRHAHYRSARLRYHCVLGPGHAAEDRQAVIHIHS